MKSLIALGRRSGLLALVALAMACSTSTSGTTSGTGGAGTGVANGTGSTTGPSCALSGDPCSPTKSCCGGFTCNGTICVSAGTGTGTGTGTGGVFMDPCPVGDVDAGCATSIECDLGLLCMDGHCESPAGGTPQCTASGIGPSAGAPCCESTQDGGSDGLACTGWIPCVTQGQSCGAGDTCCDTLSCGSDGTCDPVCGAINSVCTTDADCCADNGSRCVLGSDFPANFFGVGVTVPGSVCYPFGLPAQLVPGSANGSYYPCADFAQCPAKGDGGYDAGIKEVIDCQLGSFCDPSSPEDGGPDPCQTDGLVCDFNTRVCHNPELFEQCVPGGPPCSQDAFTQSTSPVVCSQPIFGTGLGISLCVNECQTTEDCVAPWESCIAASNPTYQICQDAEQSTGCAMGVASDLLGPCNAASVNDGICLALGGDAYGLCTQAFTDGDGGTGTSCNFNGNRQLGGLCDTSDLCLANTCGQLCNAASTAAVSCGAGTKCVPVMDVYGINIGPDPTVDAYTTGACATPCNFTLQDAGACGVNGTGVNAQGVPLKCLPAELLDYAVNTVPDFCMVGPTAAEAIPLGGDCSKANFGNALDPCVAGAECLGGLDITATCQQLCEDKEITKSGAAGGCPTGYTCTGLNFLGTASSHTGYCVAPATDGG